MSRIKWSEQLNNGRTPDHALPRSDSRGQPASMVIEEFSTFRFWKLCLSIDKRYFCISGDIVQLHRLDGWAVKYIFNVPTVFITTTIELKLNLKNMNNSHIINRKKNKEKEKIRSSTLWQTKYFLKWFVEIQCMDFTFKEIYTINLSRIWLI